MSGSLISRTAPRMVLAVLGTSLWACGDSAPASQRGYGGTAAPHGAVAATASGEKAKEAEALVFKDEDFVESISNRDPFRIYTTVFRSEDTGEIQREVVMPSTAVEDMRLIAIITGLARPKAMMVDTTGVGYVVERGDYLGRPKVIQAAGSVALAFNWRVDRIRDNELVLTQPDPSDPSRVGVTKIIELTSSTGPEKN